MRGKKTKSVVGQGLVHYLIHWRGYETDEDTWEPLANLTGVIGEGESRSFCEPSIRKSVRRRRKLARESRARGLPQLCVSSPLTGADHTTVWSGWRPPLR